MAGGDGHDLKAALRELEPTEFLDREQARRRGRCGRCHRPIGGTVGPYVEALTCRCAREATTAIAPPSLRPIAKASPAPAPARRVGQR